MPKKAKYYMIINSKFYIPVSLAKTTGLSAYTIYRHIKNGLLADTEVKPYLIYGRDAKKYFKDLYKSSGVKPGPDEYKCLECEKTFPKLRNIKKTIFTGYYYHKGKIQVQHTGTCPHCGTKFNRLDSFVTGEEKRKLIKGAEVHTGSSTGGSK